MFSNKNCAKNYKERVNKKIDTNLFKYKIENKIKLNSSI